MDELDKTPEDPDIELTPVKLSKAYDPPEAEETFEALERLLVDEAAAEPVQEASVPELLPAASLKKKESEKELANVPLENRSEVASRDRLNYRLNYTEQRRLERGEEEERESEYAQSLQGKLGSWPATRWLFDSKTRRLEKFLAFGTVVALVGVALSFGLTQRDVDSATGSVTSGDEPIESMGQALLEEEEASERLISQFFQATSLAEIMPLVRSPEVVRPLMEQWYASRAFHTESNIVFEQAIAKRLNGARYYLHFLYLEDDLDARPIAVELTDEGFRLDWETAVGYQRIPWKEYRASRPAEKVYLRVQARLDGYYNFEFADSQEWSCFRLNHPDGEGAIYGYVKRLSEIDRQLRDAMGRDEKGADYLILGLRFPENPQSDHALHIDEILQRGWVRNYTTEEGHFDHSDA